MNNKLVKTIYRNLLISLTVATLGFRVQAGAAPLAMTVAAPVAAIIDPAQLASSNAIYSASIVRPSNQRLQSAQAVAAILRVQGASTNGQPSVRNVLPNQPAQPPQTARMNQAARQTNGALQPMDSTATCVLAGSGLVGWWQAEGNANDSAGANSGTLINGVSFDSGEVGTAFSLNGSDQCVNIPYSTALASACFSVETWINPQGQPAWQSFIYGQGYGRQLIVR